MNLAERLRGVLKAGPTPVAAAPATAARSRDDADTIGRALGGEWRCGPATGTDGRCFVVERRVDAAAFHGAAQVGALAADLARTAGEAALLTSGAVARLPFLFFDLETTGLSGGAGTYAFLVGGGWFDADGAFVTRQYLLVRYGDERPMLHRFDADLASAGTMVSFNGKSFDAPLLETRYLYHRLEWRGSRMAHLDVLHPARRFWDEGSGCSLMALERDVLGARRSGDVPGFQIPARYFAFVRSGDPRPLADVLEHNRLDLLSLAGLTVRLLSMVNGGAASARTAAEALALGRVYARAGLDARAGAAYERALALAHDGSTRIDALRSLAVLARRGRRFGEAAAFWRRVLDLPRCPANVAREAAEALAIHHEHRVRDLPSAHAFALRTLAVGTAGPAAIAARPAWTAAVRHRVARIERKMTGAAEVSARLELGD